MINTDEGVRKVIDDLDAVKDLENKLILDATCGGRMMWFDKNHPLAIYMDKERREKGCIKQQKNFEVAPDIIGDFTNMPFNDNSFKLVVFDPPHAKISKNSIIGLKYGTLDNIDWEETIRDAINECMRVLEPYGILIFKWNETKHRIGDVLKVIDHKPLFGHTTAKSGKTKWICFMKI